MRFAIVGAGMSGILAAVKLKMAGHTAITVFEKADRIGGHGATTAIPVSHATCPPIPTPMSSHPTRNGRPTWWGG